MSDAMSYREACARAQIAKERFAASANNAKARVKPARLKQDVVNKVKKSASDTISNSADKVREHPVAAGAAGGAFLLFLAQRPLLALLRKSYVRCRKSYFKNMETHNG